LNQTTLKRFTTINEDMMSIPTFVTKGNVVAETAEFAIAA